MKKAPIKMNKFLEYSGICFIYLVLVMSFNAVIIFFADFYMQPSLTSLDSSNNAEDNILQDSPAAELPEGLTLPPLFMVIPAPLPEDTWEV